MADPTTPSREAASRNGSAEGPDLAALRRELASSREEVERLRGLLIARDMELGQARGRLEQLEARTTRLLGAAAWLRRFGPPFARLRAALRGRG
jgi:hypothetical protein